MRIRAPAPRPRRSRASGWSVSAERRSTRPETPMTTPTSAAWRRHKRVVFAHDDLQTPARSRISMKNTPPRSRTRWTQPSSTTPRRRRRREERRRYAFESSRREVSHSESTKLRFEVFRCPSARAHCTAPAMPPAPRVAARAACSPRLQVPDANLAPRSSSPRITTQGTPRLRRT